MSRIDVSRINRGWVLRSNRHVTRDEFDAAMDRVAADGGGTVRWFVCESTPEEVALAAAHGLTAGVPLVHMRCTLPLDPRHRLPAGFVTRAFVPGVDDEAWLAVNSRAFASHPEQGDWNREVLAARMAEPWFDPHGFLLHEIDSRIAGFCWTKLHADGYQHGEPPEQSTGPVGEIYVIGVDPAHQGKGLGRALVVAGFAHLAGRGVRRGMLYVAGDNLQAIALYESLGMTIAHRDDVYVGTVRAGRRR